MRWLGALLLCALAGMSAAETRRLLEPEEALPWAAVGRLNLSGAGICTGTLVAPDAVLTAAHCMFFPATGRPIPAEEIHFLAGWRRGAAVAHRQGVAVTIHPDFPVSPDGSSPALSRVTGPEGLIRHAHDLALVQLDAPVTEVAPFGRGVGLDPVAAFTLVSYGRGRSEVATLQDDCRLEGAEGPTLVLDCDVVPGASGAPIFQRDGPDWRIVGVVSAMANRNGTPVALAAPSGAAAALERGAATASRPGVPSGLPGRRVVGVGLGDQLDGPKVLRPPQ